MKFKITLMLLLIASMLKAQETRIVFNAPASTPADATVTSSMNPDNGWDLEMIIREIFVPKLINWRKRATEFIL